MTISIYQPAVLHLDQSQIKHLGQAIVRAIIPVGSIESIHIEPEHASYAVRTEVLMNRIEFFTGILRPEILNLIRTVLFETDGEHQKRDSNLAKELNVFVVANRFSKDFFMRESFSFPRPVRLFEWSFMKSGTSEAIFLREHKKNLGLEMAQLPNVSAANSDIRSNEFRVPEELSTAELIAFARLGIELRNRSLARS